MSVGTELAVEHAALLALDYDGTLAPICHDPERAVPAEGAREALVQAQRAGFTVAVVTGRTVGSLDSVLGIDGVWRIGRHGLERAAPGQGPEVRPQYDPEGLQRVLDSVRPAIQFIAERTPGAFVEDKATSIGLHVRPAEPAAGDRAMAEMATLAEKLDGFEALAGKKIMELRPQGAHKGSAILELRDDTVGKDAAVLFAGDDVTDEDAFRTLSGHRAQTILVSPTPRPSAAQHRVSDPAEIVKLLVELACQRQNQRA